MFRRVFLVLIMANTLGLAKSQVSHQIGFSFGLNKLTSWNGDEPFLKGSPYKSRIGYSYLGTYALAFGDDNRWNAQLSLGKLTIKTGNSQASIGVISPNGEFVKTEVEVVTHSWIGEMGFGPVFRFTEKFSLGTVIGGIYSYNHSEEKRVSNYPERNQDVKLSWQFSENRKKGIFIALDNSYQLYDSRYFSWHLTGALKLRHFFNYSFDENDRIIPEINLGTAIRFGGGGGGAF